ncbi:PREDICTED: LEAF RUST 10 DISEASE-RESISTANCE LOCUS RECEPTOR-LIKE PROTEIN KINASE-like 2.2 [Camelina sativa]|uniref:LEAF RUST 10 DISEASE-RESISTANCE LOCUS RECEPTOR-LIKE PROTEIN KINASE-like 2.2 n=1 Tax=Camelina sativa TaxID=90675 RepID=A0ABM0V597_CAMSA|nr:PREDICTED: LEAF RUST 10 DISEASE-RESISTANCE LOCUS RECEPTOR-LIKE PROTEIN KINASE-like 2.2 [Camelina sativa]
MDFPSSMGSQTTRFSLIFLFLFYYLPCALSQQDPWSCNDLFQCGNITAGFPFSGESRDEYCGHPSLKLNCNKLSNTTSLTLSGYNYTVLYIDNSNNKSPTLGLSRQDFSGPFCSASFSTTPLPSNLFQTLPSYKTLDVFYACDPRRHFLGNFTCQVKDLGSVIQNSTYRKLCDESFSVTVPTSFFPEEEVLDLTHLESVLRNGFEVKLKMDCPPEFLSSTASCSYLSGLCCKYVSGTLSCSDTTENFFHDMIPSTRSMLIKIAQVVGPNVFLVVVMVIAFLIWRKKKKANALRDQNLNMLATLRRCSYKEIKKITNSFTEVVGRGGFGTVYKGKLSDGSKVAVKVLKDSNGNCKDFINEVASMSQTSHVNIVSLLGFCYEGSKRAIVYEFLENGSLDQSLNLDVSTLYGIALGVARGLEYLHYGCKTRIVHFDIKPQNVLLDENLRPKVADFGLAKLCEKQESILSLLDTRGTVGYITPELFSRMYGNVSHKSDVYSYGMLVLEMIGARNKERVENANSNNSSAYFLDWIYKDLENGDYVKLLGDGLTREEEDIAKKMILVGLWCIQFCPSDRPSMNKFVEMMEGSLDSLNPPPKPLLHMPIMQTIAESSQPSDESSIYSEV